MRLRLTVLSVVSALSLFGCGPLEVRIGAGKIPAVKGTVEAPIPDNFVCGADIPAGEYTVKSKASGDGCEFTFDNNVQVLKESDYASIPEFKGLTSLLQAVELKITKLAFIDGSTGTALDVATQVTSVSFKVNGQQVLDKASLTTLPKTVKLEGAALSSLKTAVDAKKAASVQVQCVVVLPNMPKPPSKLKLDYDAQPELVFGTGSLKL